LFTEIGEGFIQGLKNKYNSGWDFNAGGGIAYKLGNRTNLLFSAGYMLQNGGFDFERTSTVIQPGFGERSNFNTLTPDKLHFIYSRLGLQYELGRNLFSLNGGLQWLYGAQGTIVIHTADQLTGQAASSAYGWLKTDGMQHFLWSGEVSYGYRVTPRINVNAGMKYYFSSIHVQDASLKDEGYYWNGYFPTLIPSVGINYHIYGNR